MGNERSVAPDARAVLEAFRRSGAVSFHDQGVAQARAGYEVSCAANGVPAEEVPVVADLRVGRDGSVAARLYAQRTDTPQPVALFLHGGGWVFGSLESHDRLCRFLSNHAGIAVLAVDYRLAPEHRYPAAIDDARSALDWVIREGAQHGLDAHRLALVGDSAGGQLAAVLALESANGSSATQIRATAVFYPVTDLRFDTASYSRIDSDFPLTADTMRWFADLYAPAEETDREDPALSPLRADFPRGMAATFICTVDNDPLADEGIAFAKRLAESGATVEHLHLAGYAHGLLTSAGKIRTGVRVLQRASTFLRENLYPPDS